MFRVEFHFQLFILISVWLDRGELGGGDGKASVFRDNFERKRQSGVGNPSRLIYYDLSDVTCSSF
jgi:hypothetical protein